MSPEDPITTRELIAAVPGGVLVFLLGWAFVVLIGGTAS